MRLTGEFVDFAMSLTPGKAILAKMGKEGRTIMKFLGGKMTVPISGSITNPRAEPEKIIQRALTGAATKGQGLENILKSLPDLLEKEAGKKKK